MVSAKLAATFFALPEPDADKLITTLRIVHPYGTVGKLPSNAFREAVKYGLESRYVDLLATSKGIRTFTEQQTDEGVAEVISDYVAESEHCVFLGFGFHEMNMQILQGDRGNPLRRVFGTAYHVSKSDASAIEESIRATFKDEGNRPYTGDVDLRTDLTCKTLFDEYGRSLRA